MLFPIPFMIKAKYFIMGLIFIEVCLMLSSAHQPGESVAYMAHMGGLLFGYIWLKFVPRRGFAYATSERAFGLRNSYYRWKRKRAARKFEVYMRKHDDRGDYKHEDYFDEYGNFRDPSARDATQEEWRLAATVGELAVGGGLLALSSSQLALFSSASSRAEDRAFCDPESKDRCRQRICPEASILPPGSSAEGGAQLLQPRAEARGIIVFE